MEKVRKLAVGTFCKQLTHKALWLYFLLLFLATGISRSADTLRVTGGLNRFLQQVETGSKLCTYWTGQLGNLPGSKSCNMYHSVFINISSAKIPFSVMSTIIVIHVSHNDALMILVNNRNHSLNRKLCPEFFSTLCVLKNYMLSI